MPLTPINLYLRGQEVPQPYNKWLQDLLSSGATATCKPATMVWALQQSCEESGSLGVPSQPGASPPHATSASPASEAGHMDPSWTARSATSMEEGPPSPQRVEKQQPWPVHGLSALESAQNEIPLETNLLEDASIATRLGSPGTQGVTQSPGDRPGRQQAPVGDAAGSEHVTNSGEDPRGVTEPSTWAHGREQVSNDAATEGPLFEVTVRLLTGRTHQIRAQLAAVGSPIVGDSMYSPLEGALVPAEGPAGPDVLEGVEAAVPVNGPIGLHAASLSWRGRTWAAAPPWA